MTVRTYTPRVTMALDFELPSAKRYSEALANDLLKNNLQDPGVKTRNYISQDRCTEVLSYVKSLVTERISLPEGCQLGITDYSFSINTETAHMAHITCELIYQNDVKL